MTTQALFVDIENVGVGFDLVRLVDYFSMRGELIIRRAFGTLGQSERWGKKLQQSTIDLVIHERYTTGKNLADFELVVDAMETACNLPQIDTFILVSGDSDFIPLVRKLRALGRRVIVVARESSSSPALRKFSDEFISVREFHAKGRVPSEVPASLHDHVFWAYRLYQDCEQQLEMRGIGYVRKTTVTLRRLSEAMQMLFPDFRATTFGFSKNSGMRKIMRTFELNGICELSKGAVPGELLINFDPEKLSQPTRIKSPPITYDKVLLRRAIRAEKAFRKQSEEIGGSTPPSTVRMHESESVCATR